MRFFCSAVMVAVALLMLGGCAAPIQDHSAYRPYLAHMPKTILVLPPVNFSANVHASEAFLSTVTMPLAECGYYVYPVAVIDRLFKDNGVPTAGDMHMVSLKKIDEIIGPDAVLYINIKEWTNTYLGIDSTTHVTLEYKLVDTKSGEVLWHNTQSIADSSSSNANTGEIFSTLAMMAIAAQAHAAMAAASDGAFERRCAAQANGVVFENQNAGLLKGPHSPDYEKDQKRMRDMLTQEEVAKAKAAASAKPG